MSILQEYEQIKKDIGKYKWNCIDYYLQEHPDLSLDKIIYNKDNWDKYDKWFNQDRTKSAEVLNYWKTDYDDVRANILLKLDERQVANIIVSIDEKDITELTKMPFDETKINDIENAIAVITIEDFDKYLCLPKISECSSLLQDIYDEVCETEYTMCYITDEEWEEEYAHKYNKKDIDFLKSEIKVYNLKNVITFNDNEYKIIGWGDLETRFNDDRNLKNNEFENTFNNYNQIKNYCLSFKDYDIYDYMVYIGVTNVKEDIKSDHLKMIIDKCQEFISDYCDPITVGESIAKEIYENKNITIEQLEKLNHGVFYDWYDDGREMGLPLKLEEKKELEIG